MDFKGLKIFKTIYEVKSLNKAANILGYTQSNVTAHLKKMEQELKTTLVIRSFIGIKPTEAGEQFYIFASQTLNKLAKLQQSFKSMRPTLLISELLFQFVVIESAKYTIESTDITIKKTCEMNNIINQQSYDDVICFTQLNHPDYYLMQTQLLPVSLLQSQSVTTPKQLPILINHDEDCPLRALTLRLYGDFANLITVDSLSMLLNLVEQSQGIALLPLFLVGNNYKTVDDNRYNLDYYHYRHKIS
ncbi:LysR family transcriptional regulator [uncultured Gilliamella sp.]|uniref:LysR family transcriptional regulator n=1 Tax=uncultured Gilliamella sp. TaxID=1193505 RepID=UPI0025D2E373|nr:LysR family transcriptional regulator [uncultured Gilliamella sp.]